MLALGVFVFWVPPARTLFLWLNDVVLAILGSATRGGTFVLGPLALPPGQSTETGEPSVGFVLAGQVFPALIFFAALMATLYHLRLIQPLVRVFAKLFHRFVGLSGAESLAGSLNIFFGVESATSIRPYLTRMTRSELLTVLSCGMSTVASTTLAIYVLFLQESFPQIAGHLISASVLSIPAAAIVSKLMLPESEQPETRATVPPLADSEREANALAALARGAMDGLKLSAGIATMLIAILGLAALVDLLLIRSSAPFADALGGPLELRRLLGWLFTPFAVLLGLPSSDWSSASQLLGTRSVMTEVVAYQQLAELAQNGALQSRTLLVLSYALCGFTHIASLGIFVGGVGAIAPERRGDLAALGLRALICATLATLMTGALAGVLYTGADSIL